MIHKRALLGVQFINIHGDKQHKRVQVGIFPLQLGGEMSTYLIIFHMALIYNMHHKAN